MKRETKLVIFIAVGLLFVIAFNAYRLLNKEDDKYIQYTMENVQINFINLQPEISASIKSGSKDTTNIVITGKKSVIDKIDKNDISPYVNLGSVYEGEYSLKVELDYKNIDVNIKMDVDKVDVIASLYVEN